MRSIGSPEGGPVAAGAFPGRIIGGTTRMLLTILTLLRGLSGFIGAVGFLVVGERSKVFLGAALFSFRVMTYWMARIDMSTAGSKKR